jgi:hypothetical protein
MHILLPGLCIEEQPKREDISVKRDFQEELEKRLTEEMDDWGLPDIKTCKQKFQSIIRGDGKLEDLKKMPGIALRLAVPIVAKQFKPKTEQEADAALKGIRNFRYDVGRAWEDQVRKGVLQLPGMKGGKRRLPLETRKQIALRIETLRSQKFELKHCALTAAEEAGVSLRSAYNAAKEFGVK